MNPETPDIGLNIKVLRTKRRLNQEKLAALANLTIGHLSRIETGKSKNLTLHTLQGIADGLGVQLTELISHDAA
jgi:transcriptional regulator with XRE-family HTH domain